MLRYQHLISTSEPFLIADLENNKSQYLPRATSCHVTASLHHENYPKYMLKSAKL
uniref:Uncharacterized protein n=1 Tax=Anguilla anguilla TaxID=7936 RepID=A0A0E9SYP7_ANGAN